MWALDFQFDSDWRGRAIKICNIVDEFTREHVRFTLGGTVTANDVIELVDVAVAERGCPDVLRMDNGPEFISRALARWSGEVGAVRAFIPPGQPWCNGFVESFDNRMRDELLEENLFDGVDDARLAAESWSYRNRSFYPHSSLGYRSPAQFAASQKFVIDA
ncbi:integrase [Corynebacterium sp. HMSC28B08]|nr:integrase [Corynebacterium sp. HMSC28B08]